MVKKINGLLGISVYYCSSDRLLYSGFQLAIGSQRTILSFTINVLLNLAI